MESVIASLLQKFEQGKMSRRQLVQRLALMVTAAAAVEAAPSAASAGPAAVADNKVFKAVNIHHVSLHVADYAKTRDFYAGLFGMQVSRDNGVSCVLRFGNSILVPRTVTSNPDDRKGVEHIAYMIENWDTDKNVKPAVEAELKRRGLTTERPEWHQMLNGFDGFYFNDPDGLGVEIGGKNLVAP